MAVEGLSGFWNQKVKGSIVAHYFDAGWAVGEITLVPTSKEYYWVTFEDKNQVRP